MDSKALKTSPLQRVVIVVVALLLLGSTILTYMFIVMSGSGKSDNEQLVADLRAEYDAKSQEIKEAAKPLSDKYFNGFKAFKSQVKAYNATTANNSVLKTEDLKIGTGRELAEGDYNYDAYYIGWCADGTVFESSFDNYDEPTALNAPLRGSADMIEGWNQGIVGMKLGGARVLTISGPLAYGDTQKICGEYNAPLKFVIMTIESDETLSKLNSELDEISMQLYMALYGSQM